jgi:hypothetical protein
MEKANKRIGDDLRKEICQKIIQITSDQVLLSSRENEEESITRRMERCREREITAP